MAAQAILEFEGDSHMSGDVPFTTFVGQIKQLETDFKFPVMREFFKPCFSAFEDLDEMYAKLKREGIEQFISAAGSAFNFGYRPRRFSGGPGLPSGRYFTLCDGGSFNDRGTLRDEVTAYYEGSSGITPIIYDPKVESYILDHLRKFGGMTQEDLACPFYFIIYRIERWTEKNAPLRECEQPFEAGQNMNIAYGVRQFSAEFDRIIDLRNPETQAWFVDTFVALELQNEELATKETNIGFLPKQPIESFGQLLPGIVSLKIGGGNTFSQAIGHWLRRHGANGLIFPSARSNAFNRVRDGRLIEWGGWNLVLYAGAEEPIPVSLFGRMTTWRDKDHDHIHVNYTADGAERGSFSIRGVREFSLLNFDIKKQVACGIREKEDFLSGSMGLQNEALSRAVNSILEKERLGGTLWYQDIDYIKFVTWLEDQWREEKSSN